MSRSANNDKLPMIKPLEFGTAESIFRVFNAYIPKKLTKKELETPRIWGHVGTQLRAGFEVRVLAEDMSLRALMLVTYANGSSVRMKVIQYQEIDVVDYSKSDDPDCDYEIKLRGVKKWCIVQKSTGEVFKEDIPTQKEAASELADYMQALNS